MDPLISAALEAKTVADVDRLEEMLHEQMSGSEIRYLGDRPTNWSALSGAVDPRGVLFERMTNAWDAIIEAEAQRRGDFSCKSPAEAAHKLLDVPRSGPSDMAGKEREALAARSLIALHDSDQSKKRPTMVVRDHGIGISRSETVDTILSVEGSNKLGKEYLHGVFGKGGSVTCMFSAATIIITRKQSDLLAGEEDLVTVAVVRQADDPKMRLPFFGYLVDPADKLPYGVPASETDFEPGTMVIHVGYQAERMGQTQWQYEDSIYAYSETLLFRPTLPYRLEDARSGEYNVRPEGRRKPTTMMGLGQRLEAAIDKGDLLDHGGPSRIPIPGVGEVGLRWWLLENQDQRRRRAARGNMGLFVTGGQVHHSWDNGRFNTLVEGRRRVSKRLMVEVDTESIPQKTRVTIFSSFREAMLKSDEANALERGVADWLAGDPDLAESESRFTRQALRSSGESVSMNLRQRLNRAIKARIPGLGGTGVGASPRTKPPKPRAPEELYEEPTAFTGPEEIEVLPGQRKVFYLQANAVDGFIPDTGNVQLDVDPQQPDFEYGLGDLRRGRLQFSLFVPAATELATYPVEVTLTWLRSAGGMTTLRWPVKVRVVEEVTAPKPPPGGGRRKKTPAGEVAFVWSNPDNEESWNDSVVGDLQHITGKDLAETHPETYADLKGIDEKIPTVVLNGRFQDFLAYSKSIVDKGDEAFKIRRDKYALAVGVAVASMYAQEEKLRKAQTDWEQRQNGGDKPPQPMTEAQMQRALAQQARGVLALMPDFDELLGDVEAEEHTGS